MGRSDAQLALSIGKKVDSAYIESQLAISEDIHEAVLIGERKPYPGLLILPSPSCSELDREEKERRIWHVVRKVNENVARHTQIKRSMISILGSADASKLPRNSKGTLMRHAVIDGLQSQIDDLYSDSIEGNEADPLETKDFDVILERVSDIIKSQLQIKDIAPSADLFDAGTDSVACIQIQRQIRSCLSPAAAKHLPLNVVYDCGNLMELAKFIARFNSYSNKRPDREPRLKEANTNEMHSMVRRYLDMQPRMLDQAREHMKNVSITIASAPSDGAVVLLTGSTGFLGVHILDQLLDTPAISQIVLLVRVPSGTASAQRESAARARVQSALQASKLGTLDRNSKSKPRPVTKFYSAALDVPNLGLHPKDFCHLLSTVTHIIHAAWAVNFNLPLKTFSKQVQGLMNLYNLAELAEQSSRRRGWDARPHLSFCSTVASVAAAKNGNLPIEEKVSSEPADAGDIGYGQSKWVAEKILTTLVKCGDGDYAERIHISSQSAPVANLNGTLRSNKACATPARPHLSIIRIGQLCGDTEHGIWNMKEAWPLLFNAGLKAKPRSHCNGARDTSCSAVLPDLHSAGLGALAWMPVDVAANAVLNITLRSDGRAGPHSDNIQGSPRVTLEAESQVSVQNLVYHVVGAGGVTWADVQTWLSTPNTHSSDGCPDSKLEGTQVIPAQDWLDRLDALAVDHPAKNLIGLWRKGWDGTKGSVGAPEFDTSAAQRVSPAMRDVDGMSITRERFERMLDWILEQ